MKGLIRVYWAFKERYENRKRDLMMQEKALWFSRMVNRRFKRHIRKFGPDKDTREARMLKISFKI